MATWAYLGNFSISWTTENEIKKTLEDAGHTVLALQENQVTLEEAVRTANSADYFLWTRTYNYARFDLNAMLEAIKVPTISWHLDYYFGISRELAMGDDPFWRTDYVFQPDGDHLEEFKTMGVNAYFLPPAVYAGECNLVVRPPTHELIFVGSRDGYHREYPFRQELFSGLAMSHPQLELYPKQEAIRGQALNELYQSTKVVVGDSLCLEGNQTYTSDRIFETTGRGGFILYPAIPWLTQIFPTAIFYEPRNIDSLKEKVSYYLQNGNRDEREELRRQCYEITKKDHTYANRLEEVMKVVNEG